MNQYNLLLKDLKNFQQIIDKPENSGRDLLNAEQIMIDLEDISLSDEKWNKIQIEFERIISAILMEQFRTI